MLLHQQSEVKVEFIEIAEAALKRHPESVPNIIASQILPHGLHYSWVSDTFVDLLLNEKAPLEPGLQKFLSAEIG